MTIGNIGHQPNPFKWINDGWSALKDRAHAAITHFTPAEDAANEEGSDRLDCWGIVAVDVVAHADEVEARIEIPGMEKDDLEVSIQHGRLVVQGEKHVSDEFHKGDLVITERAFGRFQRSVELPVAVEASRATAGYHNGVLSVRMPRADQAPGGRSVPIH